MARESDGPKHAGVVRGTHWLNALSFGSLLVSGAMIFTAHPRLYWGETGFFDTPALWEAPMKPILEQLWVRAVGRNVHFLAAWVAVLNGLIYVLWGLTRGHFRRRLLTGEDAAGYRAPQRAAYAGVIFLLLPLLILSGLTMSPGVTAPFPELFSLFGGRQSARTLHFLFGLALTVFWVGHVAMVYREGFREKVTEMVTGRGKGETR